MVLSVQFKGTWFLCILDVFLFYMDFVMTVLRFESCRKRQRTAFFFLFFFFHLSGEL